MQFFLKMIRTILTIQFNEFILNYIFLFSIYFPLLLITFWNAPYCGKRVEHMDRSHLARHDEDNNR